jgi:hypothetical protein
LEGHVRVRLLLCRWYCGTRVILWLLFGSHLVISRLIPP